MKKVMLKALLLVGGIVSAMQVFGHANIVSKDSLDAYTGRSYQEGGSSFINIHLSHSCRDSQGVTYPTIHTTAMFPNGVDLTGVAYTSDRNGNRYAGNALMSVKPAVDNNWKKIRRLKGNVAGFYNHGVNTTDTRGVQWVKGDVPNDMYANLEFKANLPKLDGCVGKLRVFIPVVQYCSNGTKMAWIREATSSFDETVVSPGYAPYIDIVRNMDKNPLPAGCAGSIDAEVYPSSEAIDEFLPLMKHHDEDDD